MSQQNFLKSVKARGRYRSEGEASRAVNAVFGTIKSWLSPASAEKLRQVLPQDASHLWRFSPVSFKPVSHLHEGAAHPFHFVLRVQQAGSYESAIEAARAAGSVLEAVARELPLESGLFLRRMFPPDFMEACRRQSDPGWAA